MRMTFRRTIIGAFLVFAIVVTTVVLMPDTMYDPPQTLIAHPYTDEEARGRELFYSNGCNYCHTQYVREVDNAMGPVSDGGNYVFDNPMTLGSERTGPDLAYLGRKRSEQWDINHLSDPREYSPMSLMPSFEFLTDAERRAIIRYLFNLGDRVAAEYMILPPSAYQGNTDPIAYPSITPTQSDQGWEAWTEADLQAGKELYVDRCMTCHGCAGNGLGSYGGTLIVTPANFKQEPFRSMSDEQWFWHVSEGIQGTVMPPWKESLTETERWQVIRYVQQIFARPVERDPAEGDPPAEYANLTNPVELTVDTLDEGKTIFIRECRVCHGDAGRGNGPYAEGLQPLPPDFGDGSYGDYTDADYFWRISEGLPWSAMPSWKLRYSEEDRWKLVHYIRTIFTQTEDSIPPVQGNQDFNFPDIYQQQAMPDTASYERGKVTFVQRCAHCHGLAGDGQGWDGQYLDPQPANFHGMASKTPSQDLQAMMLAKVSFGILDTAMPTWGEVLPVDQRWDVLKFNMMNWMTGDASITESVYTDQVAANFLTLSSDNWTAEGHTISSDHGAELYGQYCATCHGDDGQGNGPGIEGNAAGGPAPYPASMGEPYIMWRVWEGVPGSQMPPFNWLLSETDMWDITTYVSQMTGANGGGG